MTAASLGLASGCDGNLSSSGDDAGVTADAPGASSEPDAFVEGPGDCTMGAPLAAPIAGCAPTPLPSTGDPAEDCVRRINQFRCECQHLPPLMRWRDGEVCADMMAEYDSQGRGAHAGFRDGICSGGFAQNECPGWGSIDQTVSGCLQLMWDEGPGEPFSEHGHYINMSSSRYSMVACGFYTTPGGEVWAVQNFR